MRKQASISSSIFKGLFNKRLSARVVGRWFQLHGPAKRRKPVVSCYQSVMGLVFHVLAGAGTLGEHMRQLTGQTLNRLVKFIDQFKAMNFVNDTAMEQQLEQAKKELLSRTAEEYRDSSTARNRLVQGLGQPLLMLVVRDYG